MIELTHTMREKQFEQAIDEGLIVKVSNDANDTHRYYIKNAGVSWHEYHSRKDIETLLEAGHGGIATVMANLQQWRNYTSRRYALLKHEHRQLKQLALDKKLITRNGRPCAQCKSTNTETSGQTHYIEGGTAQTWSRQCFDCGQSEVGGDRF